MLDLVKKVLTYCQKKDRKEALWLVSNIAANSEIDAVLLAESTIPHNVLMSCKDSSAENRKEAVWALTNIVNKLSDPKLIERLVEADIVGTLIDLLARDIDTGSTASLGLTCLNQLLTRSDNARIAFQKICGQEVVENLQLSQYYEVYQLASEIIERHCGGAEMSEFEKMEFINSKNGTFDV